MSHSGLSICSRFLLLLALCSAAFAQPVPRSDSATAPATNTQFNRTQTVVTGGTGFRYELARKYGIHMGLDVAFGPDNTAIFIQVGSAWAKP
jgi:hypothetical protein